MGKGFVTSELFFLFPTACITVCHVSIFYLNHHGRNPFVLFLCFVWHCFGFVGLLSGNRRAVCCIGCGGGGQNAAGNGIKLLNVSYDVARDFYKEYNPLFIKEY